MSGFLLDTVVLSELRKRNRSVSVAAWLQSVRGADLYLSVLSLGEVERGIVSQERLNAVFARELRIWLDGVMEHYADRILPVTPAIARRWGRLAGEIGHTGVDLLIAATALEHGLTVVTRRLSHFEPARVPLFNPFDDGTGAWRWGLGSTSLPRWCVGARGARGARGTPFRTRCLAEPVPRPCVV